MIEGQILRCFLITSRNQQKLRRIRAITIQADYLRQFGCYQSTPFLTESFRDDDPHRVLAEGLFMILTQEDVCRFFPAS